MSREIAKEILYDNMSDNTAKHINDVSFLEDWIIDAMVEYHEKQVKNNDLLHSVSNPFNAKEFEYSEFIKGKGKEYHYVSNKIHYFVNGELVKILNQ